MLTVALLHLAGASSCQPSQQVVQAQTAPTSTATAVVVPSPTPIPPTGVPTPLGCLTEAGEIRQDAIAATKPPQEFIVYLPPCYDEFPERRYPVLYLLHGQTYTQDQWVRLGAPAVADQMIHTGESVPFLMVFPDDRYWNSPAGPGFGDRFINNLIPYVDENYRTLADRNNRALGGLSRGGGWTVQLGFAHPDLFGGLGLHSPAIFKDDAPYVEQIIQAIPQESRPALWLDIGDWDMELRRGLLLDDILTRNDYLHEFHRFNGDHSETYWRAHITDYLRWYSNLWLQTPPAQ